MKIQQTLLLKFQKLAVESLSGEWVLIGGAVLHLLGKDERITLDIDLARKSGQLDETLELVKIAEKLKLPISAVNQAGGFFIRQIRGWEKRLILVAESKTCRLYRPNGTLYLQLKIARMSESDLQDCLQMIRYCRQHKEDLDLKLLRKDLRAAIGKAPSAPLKTRLEDLEDALG